MVRHFFLDKTDTIVSGSYLNLSLNPIMELNYGNGVTRGIVHFDEKQILDLVEDKTFANLDKLSCHLKMTNCFSVDGLPYEKDLLKGHGAKAKRACSFEVIAFKLPQVFDCGRGYDYIEDFWVTNSNSHSNHGVSWYFARDGYVWPVDLDKIDYNDPNLNIDITNGKIWVLSGDTRVKVNLEGGIYDLDYIEEELEKYKRCEDSIIVATQDFEFGNENLNLDITKYVKDIINGEENFGLCLMFAPIYERMESDVQQYVGFFTDNTNTFFHPYVEVVYEEYIFDDRQDFSLGKKNRLYLYSTINGEPTNLDNIPICDIEGNSFTSQQATKGVYYIEINASKDIMDAETVCYDVWTNLALNGEEIEDVEMEFEIKPASNFLKLGTTSSFKGDVVPSISGINDDENLNRGEIREVTVDFRKEYTTDKKELVNTAEYRLYVKDGNREIDIIDFKPIEKAFLNNFFMIFTEDLIPHEYFVDIRVKTGRELKYYKDVLRFNVVSNVTERYE